MGVNFEKIKFDDSSCFRILRWENDVSSVAKLDYRKGRFVTIAGVGNLWHRHQEIEITLVQSGSGIRIIGDSSSEIPISASLVVLGGGLPHCWSFNGTSSGICVQWNAAKVLDLLPESSRSELTSFVDRAAVGLDVHSPSFEIARNLMLELEAEPSSGATKSFGVFLELLGALMDAESTCFSPISSTRFDSAIRYGVYTEMQSAIGWIIENFQSEIRLQQVLDLVSMSKASFGRHFKRYTGQNFSQFVNDIRVSHACRLLHSTKLSISTIALDSGFANLSNFNRLFRKSKGKSPSAFRRPLFAEERTPRPFDNS